MAVASVISGTGSWTLISGSLLVSPVTIDVNDPPTKNPILASGTPVPDADFLLFPTVKLVFTLTADGTDTVNVIGDASTQDPVPVDSIGFTANVEIDVVNDTGHALSGLTLTLANVEPSLPYNQGNSTVYYGEADYDANYAYFTKIQPVDGETMALFTPTGAATTAAGAAPSQIVLTGNIAAGATVESDSVVHNTELTSFNDFNLSVTDAPAVVAPPPPPPPPPVTLPVLANIFLQETDGSVADWELNGASIVGGGLIGGNVGSTWHMKGTDSFYGAGSNAILWQNDNGTVALWQMNGATVAGGAVVTSGGVVANPGPAWHVEGSGNFYGDGNTAILWQNDNGAVALWDLQGTNVVSGAVVGNPGPSWHIEGNADFYGDGHQAILWQNDEGAVALWDMNGTTPISGAVVAADPGPTWHIKGTGDFYGDGHQGILWQNDNGSVAIWEMNGTGIIAAGVVNSVPGPTWHVDGTGDFNGDGHTDIKFQNDNGSVAVWEMNGTNIVGGGLVANPGTAWNLANDQMQFIQDTAANLTASAVSQDEFVMLSFAAGAHSISGFNPAQDIIEFSKAQFPTYAAVEAVTTAVAGGSMINLGNGSTLSLPGVNPASMNAHNFVLA